MLLLCINIAVTTAALALIGYTLYLQRQSRKLHDAQVTLAALELSAEGDRMYWRNRALAAEQQLRTWEAESHRGGGSPRIRLP